MEPIRDCLGRVVCKAIADTGNIEIVYRDLRICITLLVGNSYTIERQGVVTLITRESDVTFSVSSNLIV